MIRYLYVAILLLMSLQMYSQFHFSEAELIIQSRHAWRGGMFGTAPAIEPSVTFSAGSFSFNGWASVTTNNSYSELDLIPSYQSKEFAVTLLDYYNPISGESNSYLNFQKDKNRHSLELTFDNYSVEERRIKWMIGTFLLGDKNEETGNSYFSTYLELKYPFTVFTIETEPLVGLTPFSGLYADGFAVVNLGISFSKELELKLPFTIPLCLSMTTNPYTKHSFVIFAGGIAF
jgi:hypothetical protein